MPSDREAFVKMDIPENTNESPLRAALCVQLNGTPRMLCADAVNKWLTQPRPLSLSLILTRENMLMRTLLFAVVALAALLTD
jgi:hypothetical protein